MLAVTASALLVAAPPTVCFAAPEDAEVESTVSANGSSVGQTIEAFELRDYRGAAISLEDYQESELVVVAFLAVDCPLVRLYAGTLADLADEFGSQGVAFLGVDSHLVDTQEAMAHFVRTAGINFPLLRDPNQRVADLFGARRTPEIFVLDRQRAVRYQGRVDDRYGYEHRRDVPRRSDLRAAIEALLAGDEVSAPYTEAPGCLIGRRRDPNPQSPVTWCRDVAPIVQDHCQHCHRPGEIAPFPLMTYEEAAGWSAMIREVVELGRMPPWHADPDVGHFANDIRLSDSERRTIVDWVAHGAAEGDPDDLPPPRQFTDGWQIGQPDVVFHMSEAPFAVPAAGVLDYEYFVVDPGWEEDRWLSACECRPGNRAVVHHINVFLLSPELGGEFERDQLTNELLDGYAPGFRTQPLPPGLAYHVPAGTRFVFQMHYTPIGTPQQDLSYLGLKFADPDKVEHRVDTLLAYNAEFVIPPGAADHQVTADCLLTSDVVLYEMIPHMHLRGRRFRYEAQHLDGTRETLLVVPAYDFNWQNSYVLAEPLPLAAGTVVECTATFDNSIDNLSNPDPEATVTWGDQTTDEMMIGYLRVARPKGAPVDMPRAYPDPLPNTPPGDSSDAVQPLALAAGSVALLCFFGALAWRVGRQRGGARAAGH